ncbi:uncharacterized protein [Antedon mediterranea]|uniref:uncharacterized protein n=1 Tax=Antedon mediterranea TaxID=105859 RepID=UPI003AF947AE
MRLESYVGSYVLTLDIIPTELIGTIPDCVIQPSDIVVTEPMYTNDELPFGFDFRLTVQATNSMSTLRNTLSNSAQYFSTNDCYLETKDVDFCSSRPTELQYVGAVYDFRVDSIYPNITHPHVFLANVSWLQPLQLNPEYVLNGYRVVYSETDRDNIVTVGSIQHEEGKDFRYSTLVTGLKANESYTVEVAAFVSKDGDTTLGKFAEITFETPSAADARSTTLEPSSTNPLTTEKIQYVNRITSAHELTKDSKDTPETSSGDDEWLNENKTVVISVIVGASLLVVGSLAFACYIARVKDDKIIEQNKMTSVRKTGNEYLVT